LPNNLQIEDESAESADSISMGQIKFEINIFCGNKNVLLQLLYSADITGLYLFQSLAYRIHSHYTATAVFQLHTATYCPHSKISAGTHAQKLQGKDRGKKVPHAFSGVT
jgi:hypothetical protein